MVIIRIPQWHSANDELAYIVLLGHCFNLLASNAQHISVDSYRIFFCDVPKNVFFLMFLTSNILLYIHVA